MPTKSYSTQGSKLYFPDTSTSPVVVSPIAQMTGFTGLGGKKTKIDITNFDSNAYKEYAGGLLDAMGGGGWGPIVTSNLLVQGSNPRKTIGTVNTAEFFLTVTISATFIATLGWAAFTVATLGLLIGGVAAAPFGAWIAKRVSVDLLLTFVGSVLTLTSAYGLYRAVS